MKLTRRAFLQSGAVAASAATVQPHFAALPAPEPSGDRKYRFVQIDVFTSRRLEGNALAVFPDARGMTPDEMLAIARETNLQETTFVIPRDPEIEREQGVKVHIYTPQQEIPFGGHPTLGTAMVLHNRRLTERKAEQPSAITLDLKVGKIPVAFSRDEAGEVFGEMHQVDPLFGKTHDRETVAALIGVKPSDISNGWPIQSVSTGLQFAIVPLKTIAALQSIRPDQSKIKSYFSGETVLSDFYYITRDTQDAKVGLRTRAIFPDGEDPATGSASGCTASWMVRYGVAQPGETVHILQGVEIFRPSHIYARADKSGNKVTNVRVGGNAVEIAHGEYSL
jgi:trans-2,3-dihydro-3-hydroxyanthranilate isomerase